MVGEFDRDAMRVLLVGRGSFGLPQAEPQHIVAVRVELEYTIVDQSGRFTLDLELPDGWRFGHTFPNLPNSQLAENQTVDDVDSYLIELRLLQAVLSARFVVGDARADLRLRGLLPDEPVLEPYADFFAPWPLTVTGTVTLPANASDPPDFELTPPRRGRRSSRAPPRCTDSGWN